MINLKDMLNESFEPILFSMSITKNIYIDEDDKWAYHFMERVFKKDWCRLKFRVYNIYNESGGFMIDVILKGDLDDLLYQLDDIALSNKKKYGGLITIQRKVNNNVSTKWGFEEWYSDNNIEYLFKIKKSR